jgi:hypothetical protein
MREKARYKKEIIEKKRANNECFFYYAGIISQDSSYTINKIVHIL